MNLAVILFIGAFGFFGSFLWDSIMDGTFRRDPTDWLGYSYLALIVMLLGYGSKYLDEVRAHPYRSATIALSVVIVLAWSAVVLWRKVAKSSKTPR